MNYWPGTNIPKSNGNAFTSWKTGKKDSVAKKESVAKQLQNNSVLTKKEQLNVKKSFTIYTKARP